MAAMLSPRDWERMAGTPIPPPAQGEYPPAAEGGEELVDITEAHPGLVYGATYRGQGIGAAPDRCLLRKTAAAMVLGVADRLEAGYRLYVYDALRPMAVQQALYHRFYARLQAEHPTLGPREIAAKMEGFVAVPRQDPLRPAPHTTGGAVDLTLTHGGEPLDMGCGFDDFSPLAATDWLEKAGPRWAPQRRNRRLLYHLMAEAGFVNYGGEWWHFSYGDRAWALATGRAPLYGPAAHLFAEEELV